MHRCRFLNRVSVYWDNQLSPREVANFEKHLKGCALCAEELERLKVISGGFKKWQVPVLDSSFDSSVTNRIVAWELKREEIKMKPKTLKILIPSGVFAGILVLVFSGVVMQNSVKRGFQGGLKDSADKMGEQFSASGTTIYQSRSRAYEKRGKAEKALYGFNASERRSANLPGLSSNRDAYREAGNEVGQVSPLEQVGEGSVIVIQPTLPATGQGQMIIRTAEVKLEVENGKETYEKVSKLCQEFGGYLAESNFYKNEEGREAGQITLRIPKVKFLDALDRLGKLGGLKAMTTHSQDVGQEYANIKAQLDATMVIYDKMLESLKKKQTVIPDAIRMESELTPVLKKVEGLKNQIERLNNLTFFTTITVDFYEARVSLKVLNESKNLIQENILSAKIKAVRSFAAYVPFLGAGVVLFIFIGGVVVALACWIAHLIRRKK